MILSWCVKCREMTKLFVFLCEYFFCIQSGLRGAVVYDLFLVELEFMEYLWFFVQLLSRKVTSIQNARDRLIGSALVTIFYSAIASIRQDRES